MPPGSNGENPEVSRYRDLLAQQNALQTRLWHTEQELGELWRRLTHAGVDVGRWPLGVG